MDPLCSDPAAAGLLLGSYEINWLKVLAHKPGQALNKDQGASSGLAFSASAAGLLRASCLMQCVCFVTSHTTYPGAQATGMHPQSISIQMTSPYAFLPLHCNKAQKGECPRRSPNSYDACTDALLSI